MQLATGGDTGLPADVHRQSRRTPAPRGMDVATAAILDALSGKIAFLLPVACW